MIAPGRAALLFTLFALTTSCEDGPIIPGPTGGSGGTGGTGGTTSTITGSETGGAGGGGGTTSLGGSGGTTSTDSTTTSAGGTGGGGNGGAGGSGGVGGSGGAGGAGGGAMDSQYGAMAGTCGELNLDDVFSPDPQLVQNTLDFTGYPMFDVPLLSPGGEAVYAAGNLGGSSLYSEIFAYEVLYWCDAATFLKGEGGIVYAIDGKKTDLLVDIDGEKVGVSVVRAMSFPKGSPYPVAQAFDVLDGKLSDILQSTMNVAPEDAWQKQILSVVAQTPDHAAAIEEAYTMVSATNKADTIVVLTVTEGDDDFIYYNQ